MDNCPKCGVNWVGGEIPDDMKKFYAPAIRWRREIGIDGGYVGIYDGIVAIRCPDCGEEFPRNNSAWALEMFNKYKAITHTF